MKIAVMGSGGVGGYFGARLAKGGADVHFVARGAHLAAMPESGIAIEGGPDPIHVPKVSATDEPTDIGIADLVLFAVKLWDTQDALRLIRRRHRLDPGRRPRRRPGDRDVVASFSRGERASPRRDADLPFPRICRLGERDPAGAAGD